MKEVNITLPFPVGTYLSKVENGEKHVDQVYEYIIEKDDSYAILVLDVFSNPRLSTKVSNEKLVNEWVPYEPVNTEDYAMVMKNTNK